MSESKRRRLTTYNSDENFLASGDDDAGEARQPLKNHSDQLRSLFVRSLPASTTTQSLIALFSESYPLKHATVVLDPLTKQSKGYGFVTFADAKDLENAKEAFDGSVVDGRKIKVELARPRTRQGQGPERAQQTEDSSAPPPLEGNRKSSRLIVRNLPWSIKDADQLSLLFRSFGKVKQASLPKRGPGLSAGFGFVLLRGHRNAEKAMEALNGKELEGRAIAVDWAVDKDTWTSLQPETEEGMHGDEIQKDPSNEGPHRQITSEDDEDNTLDSNHSKGRGIAPDGVEDDVDWNEASDEVTHEGIKINGKRGSKMDEEDVEEEEEIRDDHNGVEEDRSSTLFVRNLPFTATDESLLEHFQRFGAIRYARIVVDQTTERSRGVGFVCFYNKQDADACIVSAPKTISTVNQQTKGPTATAGRQSLLQDGSVDRSGNYTLLGRVLQISQAVDRTEAARLTLTSRNLREERDKDKRRLYLLGEGSIPTSSSLYQQLSQTEIKMREDSIRQRQSLIRTNPSLHLSLTRLSIRNLPRNVDSKALKALAREAAVGFATDVKAGQRKQLTKEELLRGGNEMKDAEQARKLKGKGIVTQAKVVFEGREGSKVAEDSGAGRSRGYGFIEYSSHRWALMGLRWLNGHAMESTVRSSRMPDSERKKRLIVEFAIENAQVVMRRRERELQARENSKLIKRKKEDGELLSKKEQSDKGALITSNPKDTKRKRKSPHEKAETAGDLESSEIAKRQRIIGRKRMLRRNSARKRSANAH